MGHWPLPPTIQARVLPLDSAAHPATRRKSRGKTRSRQPILHEAPGLAGRDRPAANQLSQKLAPPANKAWVVSHRCRLACAAAKT